MQYRLRFRTPTQRNRRRNDVNLATGGQRPAAVGSALWPDVIPRRPRRDGSAVGAGAYPRAGIARVEKSVHDTTSGCRLSRALRWRSVIPPHTPNSTLLSSASAPHSAITGQRRQITAASRCLAPRTNSASGSVPLHNAFAAQVRSSAATAPDMLFAGTRLMGRAARPSPDNELILRPSRPQSCDRLP